MVVQLFTIVQNYKFKYLGKGKYKYANINIIYRSYRFYQTIQIIEEYSHWILYGTCRLI